MKGTKFSNLREFLKTSGALPVTGGRGGHYFGHGSASAVPLKPLFLKRLGDTGLPFSSERHKNLPYLIFSKEIITSVESELTQSRHPRWETFRRLWETFGIGNGDGQRDILEDNERN